MMHSEFGTNLESWIVVVSVRSTSIFCFSGWCEDSEKDDERNIESVGGESRLMQGEEEDIKIENGTKKDC